MAEEALVDLGLFHFRHAHRNHLEVHHVVTRRGLMALSAGLRYGRRMAEFRDRPLRRRVALRAVVAEQTDVPVLGLMARRAIKEGFLALQLRCGRRQRATRALEEPRGEVGARFGGRVRLLRHLPHADLCEGDMIHFGRAGDATLMFEMAGGAGGDVSVERARLALE